MSDRLPSQPLIRDGETVLGDRPLEAWLPVLEQIRDRHGLPAGPWRRIARAKNVVFALGERWIVKLVPPVWLPDARREAAALRLVAGRLPVATPELVAEEERDGWAVLVFTRMEGEILADHWPKLPAGERRALVAQIGQVGAALHALPLGDQPGLAFDWAELFGWLRLNLEEELPQCDMPAPLRERLPELLAHARTPDPHGPALPLHGDLSAGNFLIRPGAAGWEICGLLDFGDAKAGDLAHELLSPALNLLRGDPALLEALYEGYGLPPSTRSAAFQTELLARALLYYGWGYLSRWLPDPRPTSWEEIGRFYWRLS
ncbi:MAG TPA: aminoglycoside phosphotransferase family protein [Roseiflexaceae bacterium]|nr:aminoglycoside phosphotransferase family protein [Roseiflexaceae bacterium]